MNISFEVQENGYEIMIKFGVESFNDVFINDEVVQNDIDECIYDKKTLLPFDRPIYKSDPLEGQTYDDGFKIIKVGVMMKNRINPKGHPLFQSGGSFIDSQILKLILLQIEVLNYLIWLLNQVKIYPHAFSSLYLQSILSKLFKHTVNMRLRNANFEEIIRKIIIKMANILKYEQRLAIQQLKQFEENQQKLFFRNTQLQKREIKINYNSFKFFIDFKEAFIIEKKILIQNANELVE